MKVGRQAGRHWLRPDPSRSRAFHTHPRAAGSRSAGRGGWDPLAAVPCTASSESRGSGSGDAHPRRSHRGGALYTGLQARAQPERVLDKASPKEEVQRGGAKAHGVPASAASRRRLASKSAGSGSGSAVRISSPLFGSLGGWAGRTGTRIQRLLFACCRGAAGDWTA